jgi:N-acetylglucosamine kinase-like BadF-type ATPase
MEHSHYASPTSDLLCGIDGGGTSTKVVVCTPEGEIVDAFQTGSINHNGTGIEKAGQNFAAIAARLREKLSGMPAIIFTGNSALRTLAEDSLVQSLTKGVFKPAKTIFHSDTYIALLGFTMGDPGAVLISGTGSMACGIDTDGKYHTAGGWGQILGDEGSGYHMALRGMSAALHAYDGLTEPTQLTYRLIQYFGINQVPDIIDKIYFPPVTKNVISAFATEVEIAALEGDRIAIEILEVESEWLYKLALAITGKCGVRNLGYYGSVLNNSNTIRAGLEKRLEDHSIILQKPQFSPEIGAVIGAFQEAGIRLTKNVIDNLSTYQ